jgi:hypothetical protein
MAGAEFVGEVSARIVPIDIALAPAATAASNPSPADTSTSGCESSDFTAAGFQRGDIALIQRGTCTLDVKIVNAVAAGAGGVIFFNEGQLADRTGLDFGVVGEPLKGPILDIPVMSVAYGLGYDLYSLTRSGPVVVRLLAATAEVLLPGTPATHSNTISRNSATRAADENILCGSNQWLKNNFKSWACFNGDLGGLGAKAHAY